MGNVNKMKLYFGMLFFIFISALVSFFSLYDYIGFFRRWHIIRFSWKSAGIIWSAPVFIYFSYMLLMISLNKEKSLNSKVGDYIACITIIGFTLTLFMSFYVDDKLRTEGYLICSKSSWMDNNKYVKNISLCH
ncbi:MAG: DUF1240 domain-containing protein [Enterobacteriaceae bacterium]|nr:DUF1240 domain-containing protein [Enterobacteriaceae bacterium]